jgi:hypothetical protein
MSFHAGKRIAFCALPLLALGCTESTTTEDVSEARQDVAEEQQDLDEARHEAMKPTIDEGVDADEADDIAEEQQDVNEARQDLAETERDFQATQARDQFALEAQTTLDEADRQIAALETQHDSEEGAAAEATQQKIDDLKSRRDRLSDAIDDMKGAELANWQTHKESVQMAEKELKDALGTVQ